ncbi:MAG: ACT domain-containing protein, partial [Actinomycetia bacterium]|nr:ACT domain-containing protein [Actinomycetes bacterium]
RFQEAVAEKFFPEKEDALILLGRLLYKSTRDITRITSSFFGHAGARFLKKSAVSRRGENRLEAPREQLTFDSLLGILRQGRWGLPILEDLGHEGDLESLMPGWKDITGLASADANHMHPVDTHSFYTVVEMVDIAEGKGASVARSMASETYKKIAHPDWLLLAGLLHDIGKGQNGAHGSVGADLVVSALNSGGIEEHAEETISFLVKHHLTLSHISTRRDLNDTRVIDELASLVGDGDRLRMLFLLTIADSLATGPNVWNRWKSALVQELFLKTIARLDGKADPDNSIQVNLEEKHFDLLGGDEEVEIMFWAEKGEMGEIAIVVPDRPGLFNRIAGVLSLNHLNVMASRIYTTDDGRALEVFKVGAVFESAISDDTIDRVRQDIIGSLSGQMALSYRIDKLSRRYKNQGAAPMPTRVVIENVSSDDYTIVEVYATDEIGLLYKITSALFELNLDIHMAKISTFGNEAIDVFYVSDLKGRKITSEEDLGEIEKNILFALSD